MAVPWKEALKRVSVTITLGPVGISLKDPPVQERDIVKSLFTFLEDRRVLTNERQSLDHPMRIIRSVLDIRARLTSDLERIHQERLDEKSVLAQSLKAMRAACRKFLDKNSDIDERMKFGQDHLLRQMIFLTDLGELRGTCGLQIAYIAAIYRVDISDELEPILPAAP